MSGMRCGLQAMRDPGAACLQVAAQVKQALAARDTRSGKLGLGLVAMNSFEDACQWLKVRAEAVLHTLEAVNSSHTRLDDHKSCCCKWPPGPGAHEALRGCLCVPQGAGTVVSGSVNLKSRVCTAKVFV